MRRGQKPKNIRTYIASTVYRDPERPEVVKPVVSRFANPKHQPGGYHLHDFNYGVTQGRSTPKPYISVQNIKPSHKERRFQRLVMWFALVRSIIRRVIERIAKAVVAPIAPILSDTEWNAFPPAASGSKLSKPIGYRALTSTGHRLA